MRRAAPECWATARYARAPNPSLRRPTRTRAPSPRAPRRRVSCALQNHGARVVDDTAPSWLDECRGVWTGQYRGPIQLPPRRQFAQSPTIRAECFAVARHDCALRGTRRPFASLARPLTRSIGGHRALRDDSQIHDLDRLI